MSTATMTTNGKTAGKAVPTNAAATILKATPAPKQLAVPTDLTAANTQAVTEAINGVIADAFALYLKTKNFHWHLSGIHFRDFHLLFDEHAEQILESIDPLAERIRKIGGTTLRSISHVSKLQSISDDNDAFVAPHDMILRLLADNRHMATTQRAALELCEEQRDHPTSNLLEDVLDGTERRIWFLYEISLGFEETSASANGKSANGKSVS